jgi:hypothetical protein
VHWVTSLFAVCLFILQIYLLTFVLPESVVGARFQNLQPLSYFY